jgi:hypothetical protein
MTPNIYPLLRDTIIKCCEYFGFKTRFKESSEYDLGEKGTNRILQICKSIGATTYVNASGGKHLYKQEDFKDIFLQIMPPTTHPNKLSILDLCIEEKLASL